MTASTQSAAILAIQQAAETAEATDTKESSMNRREFLTYAWGQHWHFWQPRAQSVHTFS